MRCYTAFCKYKCNRFYISKPIGVKPYVFGYCRNHFKKTFLSEKGNFYILLPKKVKSVNDAEKYLMLA